MHLLQNYSCDMQHVLELASGHPHTLHLLHALARDTAEDFWSKIDVTSQRPETFAHQLLSESFRYLPEYQCKILLAVILFADDPTLEAVCKVV